MSARDETCSAETRHAAYDECDSDRLFFFVILDSILFNMSMSERGEMGEGWREQTGTPCTNGRANA